MIHQQLRRPGRVVSLPAGGSEARAAVQVAGAYKGVTARLEVSLDGEHWAMTAGTGVALNHTHETDLLWIVEMPPRGYVAFHLLAIAEGTVDVWITQSGD